MCVWVLFYFSKIELAKRKNNGRKIRRYTALDFSSSSSSFGLPYFSVATHSESSLAFVIDLYFPSSNRIRRGFIFMWLEISRFAASVARCRFSPMHSVVFLIFLVCSW